MEIRRISLLGHKDHGKSTLIGNLLMLTGSIPDTRVQEARRASRELGVDFEPAYLLDTFSDERSGGMTFDNTRAQVLYNDVAFELIDVPGHEELIKSMLSGASNSDFSLVMVSSRKDEGITDQTRRHIYVSRLLGMSRYVVAINKMDQSGFDENVFNGMKNELSAFFESVGISKDMYSMVPVSAYTGDNIVQKSGNMPWYKGNTLLEELKLRTDRLPEYDDPEGRIFLQSAIDFGNGKALLGEVLTGQFSSGDTFRVFPGSEELNISELRKGSDPVSHVKRGDGVALITDSNAFGNVRGLVVAKDASSVHVSGELESRLFFLDPPSGDLNMHLNNVGTGISDFTVLKLIDPVTGGNSSGNRIEQLEIADVRMKLTRDIVCERFDVCRQLGRIILYSGNRLIGAGVITSIH